MVVAGVVRIVVVIVLDRLAAPHTVTHIVVLRPRVQLVHRAPVLLQPGAGAVEQRTALGGSRGH